MCPIRLICTGLLIAAGLANVAQAEVTITTPTNGAAVCARHQVAGRVSGPTTAAAMGKVWVVVHPKLTPDYWVQQSADVGENGDWNQYPYFGEAGQHVGAPYEIKAFAAPSIALRVGQILAGWPPAAFQSALVDNLVRRNC